MLEPSRAHSYLFFWDQVPQSMPQHEFDTKFETLLVFLVEAIGVPVLLSLLLLAYSSVRTQGGSNPGLALGALSPTLG